MWTSDREEDERGRHVVVVVVGGIGREEYVKIPQEAPDRLAIWS